MDSSVATLGAERVAGGRDRMLDELRKVIIGQDEVIEQVLIALFTGGHVLITGVPGLAKTLLIKTLADILDLEFKRIQFTPDLMPSDITGTEILDEEQGTRRLRFVKGPIFAQIILADEINRTPPKTQAALLEAMQEYHVTAAGRTYPLERPFFVLATQNPIELEGTYPLPEAQLDRFFFKLLVTPPGPAELREILKRTTGTESGEVAKVLPEDDATTVNEMKQLLRQVMIAPPIEDYVVRLAHATQAEAPNGGPQTSFKQYIRFGSSPRGAQSVILGAKGNALAEGRVHVSYEDVEKVVLPALRHRIILNFQAEAENISADQVLGEVLKRVSRN